MANLLEHHRPKCGVEGKCSAPVWDHGVPAGFCDLPSWGEQYSERNQARGQSGKYAPTHWPERDRNGFYPMHLAHLRGPLVQGYCCANHGGPREDQIRFVKDGNMWCAFMPDFINLAESVAGFGETQDLAEDDLAKAIGEQS